MASAHAALQTLWLIKGSHIVVRRLFAHDDAYIFQHPDGRIVFAIPYERDFTLIGTTPAGKVKAKRPTFGAGHKHLQHQAAAVAVIARFADVRNSKCGSLAEILGQNPTPLLPLRSLDGSVFHWMPLDALF